MRKSRRSLAFSVVLVTVIALLLSGCAGAEPTATPTKAPASTAPAPAAAAPAAAKGGDVEACKKEGKFVFYTTQIEEQIPALTKPYTDKYPFVNTSEYLRLQTGKLYAKITAEMDAGTKAADVLQITEISMALDFQKKGGWLSYISPSYAEYDKKFLSDPLGQWGIFKLQVFGMAYNTDVLKPDEAPKTWQDLLDPKWKGAINFKDSASGGQYNQWHMLRALFGEEYWQKMEAQKPIGLASTTQQFERLINRQDKIIGLAQSSTYAINKGKGAPLALVLPKEGVAYITQQAGVVKDAPHPECAKLFVDTLFSVEGQAAVVNVAQDYSAHPKAPLTAGTPPLTEMNLYIPKDWDEYYATNEKWAPIWNKIVGM